MYLELLFGKLSKLKFLIRAIYKRKAESIRRHKHAEVVELEQELKIIQLINGKS